MTQKTEQKVIGVDLGGTKILAGSVLNDHLISQHKTLVPKGGTESEVLSALYAAIDPLFDAEVAGIGVGVPSIVDAERGIVYDVQNIPSWKKVHLKDLLEQRYKVPVFLNNDANCFAVGEKYFGKGQGYQNFVGLICGTGIAAGLVVHNKLYNGYNCGAGEFGMLPYLDQYIEYYASGQFFQNVHQIDGGLVFQQAQKGDPTALALFQEFGTHLGVAIKTVLYTLDPEVIIMGGSVAQAYPFFEKTMWESIRSLAYPSIVERLTIKISDHPDVAVLGAAALYYNALQD